MKILWLETAKENLKSEIDYIAKHDKEASKSVANAIISKVKQLEAFPYSARTSKNKRVRELVIPHLPYIIPYTIDNDCIKILRVFHTSRKKPKRWI